MAIRSKKPVWLLFKVIELLMSAFCCYTHITCFKEEDFPHIFLHCGTYGGFTIINFLGIIGLFFAEKPTPKLEAMNGGLAGILHLITVFVTMHLVEHDFHLQFLDEFEEARHQFFRCCRVNAVVALCAVATYMLHCFLALDLTYTHVPMAMTVNLVTTIKLRKHRTRSKRPLKLYFISPGAEHYLSSFAFFQALSANVMESKRQSKWDEESKSSQSSEHL